MKWNGYYIEASQEAYDKLVELGITGYTKQEDIDFVVSRGYIVIDFDSSMSHASDKFLLIDGLKPFYLVDGEFTETKGEEDSSVLHSECRVTKEDFVLSIEDEQGKVYEFEKPDFECELLKIVNETKDKGSRLLICGWLFDKDDEAHSVMWNLHDGKAYIYNQWIEDYNLTPIKPKWYEDEDIKSKLVKDIAHVINDYKIAERWVDNLYYEGKVNDLHSHM